MSVGYIRFIETATPDGNTGGVMALRNLQNRALVLPVEIPQEDDYSFSVWLKSDAPGSMNVNVFGNSEQFTTTTAWQKFTLIADTRQGSEVRITPGSNAEYLIYQAMLETGNKPGDWLPSPEDNEEAVQEVKQALLQLTPEAIVATVMNSQSMTEFRQESDRIALLVDSGVEKVHNSAVVIDLRGILMRGGNITIQAGAEFLVDSEGSVKINATNSQDSFIKLGDIFSVSYSGGLTAGEAAFDKVTIGGHTPWTDGNIIVASSIPPVRPCIWLQPNGTTTLNYFGSASSPTLYFASGNPSLTLNKNSSGTFGASAEYTYRLTTKVSNTTGAYLGNIVFTATLSDGAHSVQMQSEAINIGAYDAPIITMKVTTPSVNLCAGSGAITATFSASRAPAGLRLHPGYVNQLNCTAAQTAGALACNVFWCP